MQVSVPLRRLCSCHLRRMLKICCCTFVSAAVLRLAGRRGYRYNLRLPYCLRLLCGPSLLRAPRLPRCTRLLRGPSLLRAPRLTRRPHLPSFTHLLLRRLRLPCRPHQLREPSLMREPSLLTRRLSQPRLLLHKPRLLQSQGSVNAKLRRALSAITQGVACVLT